MSHYWKIFFGWFLSVIVSITLVLSQFPVVSFAAVPSTLVVEGHTATWSDGPFPWEYSGKYFTVYDRGSIPNGSYLAPAFFYTLDGVTFDTVTGTDVFTLVYNKVLGLVIDPTILDNIWENFLTYLNMLDTTNNKYCRNGLYDGNDNFLGVCLNDISGCYFVDDADKVTVPNDFCNNVYNHYKYYMDNYSSPDYFIYTPPDVEYLISKFPLDVNSDYVSKVREISSTYDVFIYATGEYNSPGFLSDERVYYNITDYDYVYHSFDSGNNTYNQWVNFCSYYGVNNDGHLNYSDIEEAAEHPSINFDNFDSSGNRVTGLTGLDTNRSPMTSYASSFNQGIVLGSSNLSSPVSSNDITIYKSLDILNGIKNETYYPGHYTSVRYYNYNPVNDNSFTINKTIVDDSITTNQTIYDNCNNDFYESVENTIINNEEIINNNSTIINNYYPIVDDDPVGPDDPDNPSGGDDDPDIDNETVLDAILDALARFFRAIGKILATILAGLLEVVDTVLEAVAGIMENFTGITDFLGALFSWLPSPIPEVIGAGVSICILFAIFRFIRG